MDTQIKNHSFSNNREIHHAREVFRKDIIKHLISESFSKYHVIETVDLKS